MGNGAPMFAPPPGAPMSFADIFEQVSPAVVQIDVTSKAAATPRLRIPGLEGFDIVPRGQKPGEEGEEAARSQAAVLGLGLLHLGRRLSGHQQPRRRRRRR
jgi:serine protease Do